jgi:hypothetical protein
MQVPGDGFKVSAAAMKRLLPAEKRQRMNLLVVGIQAEKDYDSFADQAREIYDLIERKARRFGHASAASQPSSRAWRTVPAV